MSYTTYAKILFSCFVLLYGITYFFIPPVEGSLPEILAVILYIVAIIYYLYLKKLELGSAPVLVLLLFINKELSLGRSIFNTLDLMVFYKHYRLFCTLSCYLYNYCLACGKNQEICLYIYRTFVSQEDSSLFPLYICLDTGIPDSRIIEPAY